MIQWMKKGIMTYVWLIQENSLYPFNPDKYKSKNGKNKNPEISTRLIQLKKEIDKQIERIKNEENTEQLEIQYMYYDNYN